MKLFTYELYLRRIEYAEETVETTFCENIFKIVDIVEFFIRFIQLCNTKIVVQNGNEIFIRFPDPRGSPGSKGSLWVRA